MTRKFRGDTYNLTIKNESGKESGITKVTLYGKDADEKIKLVGDGKTHEIVIVM